MEFNSLLVMILIIGKRRQPDDRMKLTFLVLSVLPHVDQRPLFFFLGMLCTSLQRRYLYIWNYTRSQL